MTVLSCQLTSQDVIAISESKGDHLVKLLSVDPDK